MVVPFKKGVMHLSASAADKKNYLIGGKCQVCGAIAFPKRAVCHKCRKDTVEEVPLGRRGKLASFTVAWAAPEGIKPPMVLGYVDMPEGVRLLSMITNCEPKIDALELGQEMDLVFEEIRRDDEGNQVVAYKFKPVLLGEVP